MKVKYILVFEINNIDLHAIGSTTQFFNLWSPIALRMGRNKKKKKKWNCSTLHDGLIEDPGRRLWAPANRKAGIRFQ
jgi:hypothetical protein